MVNQNKLIRPNKKAKILNNAKQMKIKQWGIKEEMICIEHI